MRNIHERHIAASAQRLGEVLETLATGHDELWPSGTWAPMVLDHGLEPGSHGGHYGIRYTVTAHEAGRLVEFTFDRSSGVHGTHTFTVVDLGDGTSLLRHVLQGRAHGTTSLVWPLAVRWLHDALIEDALDRAETALGVGPTVRARWSPWVRLVREALPAGSGRADVREVDTPPRRQGVLHGPDAVPPAHRPGAAPPRLVRGAQMTRAPAAGADAGGLSVLVIGAGYAGVIATNRLLASLSHGEADRVRVTVVNPRPDFVERIRLHELAAGSRSSVFLPLADILHRDARLLVGTARRIDSDAHTVTVGTAAGDIAEQYDLLVYAPGSVAAAPVPGATEHAHLLADLDGAQSAAHQLARLASGSRVVVVGGGFTGVEAAAEIAERRPGLDVTLLSSGPVVTQMRPRARTSIRGGLARLGVHVIEDATADRITNGAVMLADGRTVAFDSCLVALSFAAPDLARTSGLDVDSGGRLRVDETLRCTNAPRIIGAGDAIVTPDGVGAHLRMSCAAALPLGGHAAETVLHLIRGQEPARVSIGFVLQCASAWAGRTATSSWCARTTAHAPEGSPVARPPGSRNASAASSSTGLRRNDVVPARTAPPRALNSRPP